MKTLQELNLNLDKAIAKRNALNIFNCCSIERNKAITNVGIAKQDLREYHAKLTGIFIKGSTLKYGI